MLQGLEEQAALMKCLKILGARIIDLVPLYVVPIMLHG
jgi:hypothetical protein